MSNLNILKTVKETVLLTELNADMVRTIQEVLGVSIDGIVGNHTAKAFSKYKADNDLGYSKYFGETTAKKMLELAVLDIRAKPVTRNDHIKLIVAEIKKQSIATPDNVAYILATTQHETAGTFLPISEYGGNKTRYAPYYGRGYVQLTWERNYRLYQALTNKPLVANPDLVKEPYTAAFIMVHGFRTGTFTGKKISTYLNTKKQDFYNARRCINGLDKAENIAVIAKSWLQIVQDYL